jgi:hypothetical protein
MIDTKKLYELHINEVKIQRTAARGFMQFMCSIIDDIQNVKPVVNYLELGVSGAGAHSRFSKAGTPNVYGVERVHPDKIKGIATEENDMHSYNTAMQVINECGNITVLFGESAYAETTPIQLSELSGIPQYDIVNDDAATDWPRMRHSLAVWKTSIDPNGAFFTEVPDGMGVESWWAMSREDHINNYKELAQDGLVVFDLECDKIVVPGFEKDWDAHFFGLWMPNWNIGKRTIENYRHAIVAGHENINYGE